MNTAAIVAKNATRAHMNSAGKGAEGLQSLFLQSKRNGNKAVVEEPLSCCSIGENSVLGDHQSSLTIARAAMLAGLRSLLLYCG